MENNYIYKKLDNYSSADTDTSKPSPDSSKGTNVVLMDPEIRSSIVEEILDPTRLATLLECDANISPYDPNSFAIIFYNWHRRNLPMIVPPLTLIFAWSCLWAFAFPRAEPLRLSLLPLDGLINPLLTPVSFLLVFRLGRSAVRYWDSRAATGKLVKVCRELVSTAAAGCARDPDLVDAFARWNAAFPVATKNFLRAAPEGCDRRAELGSVLRGTDRERLLRCGDERGDDGRSYGPVFCLNRMRQLAYRAGCGQNGGAVVDGFLYRQLNDHIDGLCGAWGALERINLTPLPFVYVVQLRTFLVIYLLFWSLLAVAKFGWISILAIMLESWGLMGIEAAAVECERPFRWDGDHLPLGKMCVVVAKNVAQTLLDVGHVSPTLHNSDGRKAIV